MADDLGRYEDNLPKLNGVPIDTGGRFRRTGTGELMTRSGGFFSRWRKAKPSGQAQRTLEDVWRESGSNARRGTGAASQAHARPAQAAASGGASAGDAQRPAPAGGYRAPEAKGASEGTPLQGGFLAVASILCGICSIAASTSVVFSIALGVVAIVLASKSVRQSGRNGAATAGRTLGIIGIAFSVVMMCYAAFMFVGDTGNTLFSSDGAITIGADSDDDGSDYDYVYDEAQEAQATEAFEAMFASLASPDDATVDAYAAEFDRLIAGSFGISSLSELGVEPQEFARWMLESLRYTPDGVYLYTDGTGSAYAECQVKDYFDFLILFSDKLDAYSRSPEGSSASDGSVPHDIAGQYMREAMDETEMGETYVFFELRKTDGEWEVADSSPENVAYEVFRVS